MNFTEIAKSFSDQEFGTYLFVFAVLCLFKSDISKLLRRININYGNKSLNIDSVVDRQNKNLEPVDNFNSVFGDSIEIKKRQDMIHKDLNLMKLEDKNKTIDLLVKQLAEVQHGLLFQLVYQDIFGSQIKLLKKLNCSPINQDDVIDHFKAVKEEYSDVSRAFGLEDYLKFLIKIELIFQNDKTYYITGVGKDFLIWMARFGKQEDKYF